MKNHKSSKSISKSPHKFIFFVKTYYKYFLFCLFLFSFDAFYILSKRSEIGGKNVLIVSSLLIVFLILTGLVFWLKEKKHLPLHRIFLIVAPIIGLIYLFIMPLSSAPDELNHFCRAYEISEGFIVSDRNDNGLGGHILPDSITKLNNPDHYSGVIPSIDSSIDASTESFQVFTNASLYSPLSYFPEVLGIWLGRIFQAPMFIIYYLARLFNLAFYIFLIYFSIKKIPTAKSTLLLIALSPIALQAAASCQADALINGAILAFASLVFYKIKHPTSLTKSEKLIFSALTILIAMCKIVYLPFCLLLCLLPKSCFKSPKDKIIKLTTLLSAVIACNLIWLALSSGYLIEFNPGVNSGEQVKFVLTHPLHYLVTIFYSFIKLGFFYFSTGLSNSLGWLNINLPTIFTVFFGIFLIYTYLGEDRTKLPLKSSQKAFLSLIILACVLLICTSLYVQWTPVGAATIDGIQGRYFLPLIPIALLLIKPFASRHNALNDFYPLTFIISLNVVALSSFAIFYII